MQVIEVDLRLPYVAAGSSLSQHGFVHHNAQSADGHSFSETNPHFLIRELEVCP
jgi:hypothetical protein